MVSSAQDPIDVANAKDDDNFIQDFMPPREQWGSWEHPSTGLKFELVLKRAKAMSDSDFEACFKLVEQTSSEDYRKSEKGWKPNAKRKEMKLLDLKYILVKRDGQVKGFVSLMPTYEDDYPVIYCYEIHLSTELQGNQKALRFYQKLGYSKDEFSPAPRILRNGTVVEPDYIILSRKINYDIQ
ncbi:hypothetical protein F5884DRAFT_818472 [Xylogone sp. PMI_703]|nr:hypothetical protein F5884DRAFT_818472 [Xylogone sp. PMI_703]